MATAPKGGVYYDVSYTKFVCGTDYCRCHLVVYWALPKYVQWQEKMTVALNLGTKNPRWYWRYHGGCVYYDTYTKC